MIRLLIQRLLLVGLIALIVLNVLERFNPTPMPLLVKADYQRCVTIVPGPIQPPHKPVFYPNNSDLT